MCNCAHFPVESGECSTYEDPQSVIVTPRTHISPVAGKGPLAHGHVDSHVVYIQHKVKDWSHIVIIYI